MVAADLFKNAVPLQTNILHTVMILAPHPDDESLGCGGTIAWLVAKQIKVYVVFITDGSTSHPNSKKYPAQKLAATRKAEAIAALQQLGIQIINIFFLDKKDRSLPGYNEPGFEKNAEELKQLIDLCKPQLVFVPYQKDPHPDHRATWQMLMHERSNTKNKFKILEYVIWLYNMGNDNDLPEEKFTCTYVDIRDYTIQKQKAISQHISQTTRLIDDDPEGFILTPDVLQHFNTDKEFFLDRNL